MKKSLILCSTLSTIMLSACTNSYENSDEMPSQMSPREEKLISTCENITKDDTKHVKKCVDFYIEGTSFSNIARIAEHIPVEEWRKKEQLIYEQSMIMIQASEATNQGNLEKAMSIYTEVKNNENYLDNVRTLAEKEIDITTKQLESIQEVQTRIQAIRNLIDDKKIEEAKVQLEPMVFELSGTSLLQKEHAQVEAMLKEIKNK